MLSNEAAMYWSACRAARASAQGDDPEAARYDVLELAPYAAWSKNPAIRNGARKALAGLTRAPNPAARRAAKEALADVAN